jgi:hypothetical protein
MGAGLARPPVAVLMINVHCLFMRTKQKLFLVLGTNICDWMIGLNVEKKNK